MSPLELLSQPQTWISLLTLTLMEIVLGIDNIVFIAILTGRLPKGQQPKARRLGIGLALVMRLGLLMAISWVMGLNQALFELLGHSFSGRDLILLGGGLFLIGKATHEIHSKLEAPGGEPEGPAGGASAFGWVLVQIVAIDVVFSLDSVITAIGMSNQIPVMVAAMVISVGVMLVFAGTIGDFVERHPTMKILALSFLMLIGAMLVAEGMGQHVSKGYIYSAMAFSLLVEVLNMRLRKKAAAPVHLHSKFEKAA